MPLDVLMPQLSPTMTEGRFAGWKKKEGDAVKAGDVIAEVETDKATMEVEATEDGTLYKFFAAKGEDIKVGTPIAVLARKGETVAADYKPAAAAATPAPAAVEQPVAQPSISLSPTTNNQQPTTSDRLKASPLAKRVALQKGVSLSGIAGSGPHGRIVLRDVENTPTGFGAPRTIVRRGDSTERLSPMRKAIAARLTQSKQSVPHFYLQASVRMDRLIDLRTQLNAHYAGAYKISVNDFIVKACALGLAKHPTANAAWNSDSVVLFGNVDISVAVAIDGGLITPIVQNADQKPLAQISSEVKQLAERARNGQLKPHEYEGGSFSLSNLGMYGVENFAAIINPPQAAILACGKAAPAVVADEDGNIETATVMQMTLSVDHRVIDGALGAELLAEIKEKLENPVSLIVG